jgi:hypothetical protein
MRNILYMQNKTFKVKGSNTASLVRKLPMSEAGRA